MHTLCVGTIVAGSALVPNYLSAQQTDNLAREAAGQVDAKYLDYPLYQGNELELTVEGNTAKFRLWSPAAQAVRLRIYDHGRGGQAVKTIDMTLSLIHI